MYSNFGLLSWFDFWQMSLSLLSVCYHSEHSNLWNKTEKAVSTTWFIHGKVTIWRELHANFVLSPYHSKCETASGINYFQMLDTYIRSKHQNFLRNDGFQHSSAPPHNSNTTLIFFCFNVSQGMDWKIWSGMFVIKTTKLYHIGFIPWNTLKIKWIGLLWLKWRCSND